jgi:hypothetical protein
VGIGSSDFGNMQTLDGDSGLYSSNGKKAVRDVVQFVPFRDVGMNPDLLAKELLAELPEQIVSFMVINGLFRKVLAKCPIRSNLPTSAKCICPIIVYS